MTWEKRSHRQYTENLEKISITISLKESALGGNVEFSVIKFAFSLFKMPFPHFQIIGLLVKEMPKVPLTSSFIQWQRQAKTKCELLFTLGNPLASVLTLSLEACCLYIGIHRALLPSWCSTVANFLIYHSLH